MDIGRTLSRPSNDIPINIANPSNQGPPTGALREVVTLKADFVARLYVHHRLSETIYNAVSTVVYNS